METLAWRRSDLITEIRTKVWRYLTPAADVETAILEASALLRFEPTEVRRLAWLQFLTSDELGAFLADLPALMRRLASTTQVEEEWSSERIRGPILWGKTIGLRGVSGSPFGYATAPARRAYQTPENELLVAVLARTIDAARSTGWRAQTSDGAGRLVRDRVSEARKWGQSQALLAVEPRPITPAKLARIRTGRHRRRYELAFSAYLMWQGLVGRLDRELLQRTIEDHGLVSRDDPTLFELLCTFRILECLQSLGWKTRHFETFSGGLKLACRRGEELLELSYQYVPDGVNTGSVYARLQRVHDIEPGALRPDLVLRRLNGDRRCLIVEVKGGHRAVEQSARAALFDLLAYRSAFEPRLAGSPLPWGLGIAWGQQLKPNHDQEVMLCTPDQLLLALSPIFG